ncbi:MAG TPA: hypothetical protein DCZ94_05170 [Lentisphaeria bacterium]|nr:MAG: hypothetical protein A2X48_00085 [Lentisphaerae bacterium GWF2_49_21]HBC86329.1 hypothetical protein [Lentisphaeria bacterium]
MIPQDIKSSLSSLGAVLAVAVAVILGQGAVAGWKSSSYPSAGEIKKWMTAVQKGDFDKALSTVGEILRGSSCYRKGIGSDYLKIAGGVGLEKEYFSSGPDFYDCMRWESASFIRNMMSLEFKGGHPSVEELFRLLNRIVKVGPSGDFKQQALTPADVWRRGRGNTHEAARLLCEMAFQEAYEAQTISLYDSKGEVVHLLCEFRKGAQVDTVDIRFGKVWKGRSFAEILKDKNLRSGIWPENIENCAERFMYGIPAEPQDYKASSQYLYKYSVATGVNDRFRFGEDPRERIESYLRYFSANEDVSRFTYWRYPFQVMTAHLNK